MKFLLLKKLILYATKIAQIIKKYVTPNVGNILDWADEEIADVNGSGLYLKTLNIYKRLFY